jgi:hypothetical protein
MGTTSVGGIWPDAISSDKNLLIQLYALRFLDFKQGLSLTELHIFPSSEGADFENEREIDDGSPTFTGT